MKSCFILESFGGAPKRTGEHDEAHGIKQTEQSDGE
jgi:hypothetical protein